MKQQESITEHKLKMAKLSEELKGNFQRVADEAEVSISTVQRVLDATYKNWSVIAAAVKVRNKLIAEKLQQEKLLDKI